MMPENDRNPYAAPAMQEPLSAPETGGIFQSGKFLVVHKQAIFPNRCIKSNEPTTERLKRKLMWHHPAVYLVLLLNLLIYAIVAIAVRKTAVFQIPLAARYKQARLKWMLIAWSTFIVSLALFIAGMAMAGPQSQVLPALCMLQFPFGLITAALMGIFGCRVIYAKKIDNQFAWIGGAGEEFRRSFPEWPYPNS